MHQALDRSSLRGIWIPLIVCWRDDGRVDEARYAKSIRAFKGTGIHGVYTGGTTGEFYAQDDKAFEQITAVTCEEADAIGLPVQIGCSATATSMVARRIAIARSHHADAIQIALPFWMELSDRETREFFSDLAHAAQGTPLVLYQTGRTKKVISPSLLARIADDIPELIGVKDTLCSSEGLAEIRQLAPDLAIFGGDRDIADKLRVGGTGAYSAVALLNPQFVSGLYNAAASGDWEDANARQAIIRRFFDELLIPMVLEEGLSDSAIDRVQCVAGGVDVGLSCQKPYRSAVPAHVERLRKWCIANAPELLNRRGVLSEVPAR